MVLNPAVGAHSAALFAQIRAALGEHYTLEAELPPGGMSRVFVATDATLNRSIVVKVLPPELAGSLSIERFRREIALEAQLQHPHIVPVHQAGNADGLLFYTMPKIDGESLRARIDRVGELPLRDVADILRDVTRAIGYAHGKGIVHRDIKPENVILTGDAAVVLDFGVAKALSASGVTTSTGGTGSLTGTGVSVGTPAYMAPEQATGERGADHRVDIYALGVLGYEMLTGTPPFAGRTIQAILAAHVTETPADIATRRPAVPPALAQLVMRCLAKHPADRPQSAAEVLAALNAIGPSGGAIPAVAPARTGRREAIAWAVTAVMAVVAVAAFARNGRDKAPGEASFSTMLPPLGAELHRSKGFMLSPDGATLAFVADGPTSVSAIWLRRVGQRPMEGLPMVGADFRDGARIIAGSENGTDPFWSADGKSIGFVRDGWIWLTSASGGTPRRLAEAPSGLTPTWGSASIVIFRRQERLWRVAADRSDTPRPVFRDSVANFGYNPRFFPDGRHFVYVTDSLPWPDGGRGVALWLGNLDGGDPTFLLAGEYAEPVANDLLVFRRGDFIWTQRVDLAKRRIKGKPVQLVRTRSMTASPSRLVMWDGVAISEKAWLDRRGIRLGALPVGQEGGWTVQIANDGRRVIVSGNFGWVYDMARAVYTRIPNVRSGSATSVVWAPRDTAIIFGAAAGLVQRVNASTMAKAETLFVLPAWMSYVRIGDVAPDGTFIAWYVEAGTWPLRTGIAAVGRDGTARVVISGRGVGQGVLSPDGRWIAHTSDETGSTEVYVRPMPRGTPAVRVSRAGGRWPRWSRDELFFIAPGDVFMAVTVSGGDAPRVGIPRELFRRRVFELGLPPYDVTADGQRFLVMAAPTDLYSRTFTLLDNWPALIQAAH